MFVIYLGDSSEYFVNGIHVSQAKYMAELEKIGIVTKAQNCLVFQVRAVLKFSVDIYDNITYFNIFLRRK